MLSPLERQMETSTTNTKGSLEPFLMQTGPSKVGWTLVLMVDVDGTEERLESVRKADRLRCSCKIRRSTRCR